MSLTQLSFKLVLLGESAVGVCTAQRTILGDGCSFVLVGCDDTRSKGEVFFYSGD